MKKRVKKWLDNFNIKLIIITHVHVDHTWNIKYIKDLYNCKVAIGINDKKNIDNSKIDSIAKSIRHQRWTNIMNWGMNKFIPNEYEIDYYLKNNYLSPNTISFYIKHLRAVYNRAVEDGLIVDRKPFRRVSTSIEKTTKRALPLKIIKRLKKEIVKYE